MYDGNCWCSHDPVFASNYFVANSENFDNSCFENFMPSSPQLDAAVVAILQDRAWENQELAVLLIYRLYVPKKSMVPQNIHKY